MATVATTKRKNIDLPVDTLQKLSYLAVSQGKSLKSYIEGLLIIKANQVKIEVKENPSPSGDPWWDIPENVAMVEEGLAQARRGETREYTIDQLRERLGL